MSELLAKPKICVACNKPGCTLKCPCKLVNYCGEECQRAHWPTHKKDCRLALAKKVKDAKREHGRDHEEVVKARIEAGAAHTKQGRFKEAERCYLEAHRMSLELYEKGSTQVCFTTQLLATHYRDIGRYDESLKMQRKILKINRRAHGERSRLVGNALVELTVTLHSQGVFQETLEPLEEAHSIFLETGGPDDNRVAKVLNQKGHYYRHFRQHDEARAAYQESLRIHRKTYGDDTVQVAVSLGNLGSISHSLGLLEDARAAFEEALGIMRRFHGEKHPAVAMAFNRIGQVLGQQGQNDESLKMFKKALKINRRVLGDHHEDVATSLTSIGLVRAQQGQYDEAIESYGQALAIYTRVFGIDNKESAQWHMQVAVAKDLSDDVAGAIESARESVRIFRKHGVTDFSSEAAADLLRNLQEGLRLS